MSWKPMDAAPKDGTVIILYVDLDSEMRPPIPIHAFYQKRKGLWSVLDCDRLTSFDDLIMEKDEKILLGWIEVPDSTPLAGKKAYREDELAREPGKLHIG